MADKSYTHLRENLAEVLDKVVDDREIVVIRRKGARNRGARAGR